VLLFNHGVHHLDVIRFVTGACARRIDAVEWDPAASAGQGRCLRLTIHTDGGYVIGYDASYAEAGLQTPQSGELRISGTTGTLEAFGEFEDPQLWLSRNQKASGEDVRERIAVSPVGWDQIDQHLIEGFARAIEENRPAETDIEDNLQTLDWLFRAAEVLKDRPAVADAKEAQ
jgi:predicted dehydrogenase